MWKLSVILVMVWCFYCHTPTQAYEEQCNIIVLFFDIDYVSKVYGLKFHTIILIAFRHWLCISRWHHYSWCTCCYIKLQLMIIFTANFTLLSQNSQCVVKCQVSSCVYMDPNIPLLIRIIAQSKEKPPQSADSDLIRSNAN